MKSFDNTFFINNRKRLSTMLPNTVVVISAHSTMQYSADMAYPFRQDSNFWYLTGINEPDLVLVIDTTKNESTIILPEQSEYHKQWDGEIDTVDITQTSGISAYRKSNALTALLTAAKKDKKKIGYLKPFDERVEPYGFYANPARRIVANKIFEVTEDVEDCRLALARLRQIKQAVEIDMIKKAVEITGESLSLVKSRLRSFQNESDVERQLTIEFYARQAEGHGYEPIVASGGNAATIHYNKNNVAITNNSLLLLDVGAKYAGYSADISRTWATRKPSKRQAEVHRAVLDLQDKALSLLKPGTVLKEYQKKMEKHAKEAMQKLHCSNAAEKYPHGFSHFLGLDVHDAGDYDSPLEEGMVLTVEPGIYIPEEAIGVRIEDNIVITKDGIINLSSAISRDL
jgi:Xaa-Pro aminopeptidase